MRFTPLPTPQTFPSWCAFSCAPCSKGKDSPLGIVEAGRLLEHPSDFNKTSPGYKDWKKVESHDRMKSLLYSQNCVHTPCWLASLMNQCLRLNLCIVRSCHRGNNAGFCTAVQPQMHWNSAMDVGPTLTRTIRRRPNLQAKQRSKTYRMKSPEISPTFRYDFWSPFVGPKFQYGRDARL